MEIDGFIEHMKTVHGLEKEKLQGQKQMVMHLDGKDWYASTYQWTFGDVSVIENSRYERDEESRMYWGE